MYKNSKAFSIIELMVVIGIVAVLSAVSVVAFKEYKIKASILKAVPVAQQLMQTQGVIYQQTGEYPETVDINGVTLVDAVSWEVIDYDNMYVALYAKSADSRGARLHVAMTGLEGMPSYVAPVSTANLGARAVLVFAVREGDDGLMQYVCGRSVNPTNMIPADYAPAACDCEDIGGFTEGTASCN